MKILHVNTLDKKGGAARAASRLHQSLLQEGVDSHMLVQRKSGCHPKTKALATNFVTRCISLARTILDQLLGKRYQNWRRMVFSPSWFGSSNIVSTINQMKPDIIHLHWICHAMIRIEDIKKINAPIVWSLHDMWAFSGGCHYDGHCGKYEKHCEQCPVLNSSKQKDISYHTFRRKMKTFSQIHSMTIVGLSNWLSNCAKQSTLLKDKQHRYLPNPIDANSFKPSEKTKARKHYNLPENKQLILFGALNATSDPNKGFQQLCEALEFINNKENIELVIFGAKKNATSYTHNFKTHSLSQLNDNKSLAMLYSAADITIVPSLQEAFSQVTSESMACATPVVAFKHTGLLDLINHKKNGYLAKPFDTKDLAAGVEWVLNHPEHKQLCNNARTKVQETFDYPIVSKKYIALYKEIIAQQKN